VTGAIGLALSQVAVMPWLLTLSRDGQHSGALALMAWILVSRALSARLLRQNGGTTQTELRTIVACDQLVIAALAIRLGIDRDLPMGYALLLGLRHVSQFISLPLLLGVRARYQLETSAGLRAASTLGLVVLSVTLGFRALGGVPSAGWLSVFEVARQWLLVPVGSFLEVYALTEFLPLFYRVALGEEQRLVA
jgi:hypothetical protein